MAGFWKSAKGYSGKVIRASAILFKQETLKVNSMNRRNFLKASALVSLPVIVPSTVFGANALHTEAFLLLITPRRFNSPLIPEESKREK